MAKLGDVPFGLLELGSNSLKFHIVEPVGAGGEPDGDSVVRTRKFPWRVAHEFFANGRLSEPATTAVIETIRGVESVSDGLPLDGMLAVATGVFRELSNIDEIERRVKSETGLRIRLISGHEEAKLMARGFRHAADARPLFVLDLGGATTEWAWFEKGSTLSWGSLPLGAIRNEYLLRRYRDDAVEYLRQASSVSDAVLARLPFRYEVDVIATGGTAKAAALCCGGKEVTIGALRALMEEVFRNGPPASLKPARRAVFLPGLTILWRVLVRCKADRLVYGKNSVRSGMATRLIRLLGSYDRQNLRATLLLHSTEIRRRVENPDE